MNGKHLEQRKEAWSEKSANIPMKGAQETSWAEESEKQNWAFLNPGGVEPVGRRQASTRNPKSSTPQVGLNIQAFISM